MMIIEKLYWISKGKAVVRFDGVESPVSDICIDYNKSLISVDLIASEAFLMMDKIMKKSKQFNPHKKRLAI